MRRCILFFALKRILTADCEIESPESPVDTFSEVGLCKDIELAMINCLGSGEDCINAMKETAAKPESRKRHAETVKMRMNLLYLATRKNILEDTNYKLEKNEKNKKLTECNKYISLQKNCMKHRLKWICDNFSCSLRRHTNFKNLRKFKKEIQVCRRQRIELYKKLVTSKFESKDKIMLLENEFEATSQELTEVEECYMNKVEDNFTSKKNMIAAFIALVKHNEDIKTEPPFF